MVSLLLAQSSAAWLMSGAAPPCGPPSAATSQFHRSGLLTMQGDGVTTGPFGWATEVKGKAVVGETLGSFSDTVLVPGQPLARKQQWGASVPTHVGAPMASAMPQEGGVEGRRQALRRRAAAQAAQSSPFDWATEVKGKGRVGEVLGSNSDTVLVPGQPAARKQPAQALALGTMSSKSAQMLKQQTVPTAPAAARAASSTAQQQQQQVAAAATPSPAAGQAVDQASSTSSSSHGSEKKALPLDDRVAAALATGGSSQSSSLDRRARELAQQAIDDYFAERIDEAELKRRKEGARAQAAAESAGAGAEGDALGLLEKAYAAYKAAEKGRVAAQAAAAAALRAEEAAGAKVEAWLLVIDQQRNSGGD